MSRLDHTGNVAGRAGKQRDRESTKKYCDVPPWQDAAFIARECEQVQSELSANLWPREEDRICRPLLLTVIVFVQRQYMSIRCNTDTEACGCRIKENR